MIDTHVHLTTAEVSEKLKWVVLSASSLEDSKENLELAKKNKKLLPAVGIHPCEKVENIDEAINTLDDLIDNSVIAIGECGLDFAEEVDKRKQEILFRGQIALSLKHDKPLIVHSREASDETLDILKSYKNIRGVIHCYTGGKKRIVKVPESFYFGIDGNLTYEIGLNEVVKNIPKNRLILETDTPYLTPTPYRGETNKPEYVEYVYKKVAEIWGVSFEETEKIIDENAKRLFGI